MTCLQIHVVVQLFLWRYHLCEVRRPPEIGFPSHDEVIYYRDNEEVQIRCVIKDDTQGTYNEFKWTKNGTVIQNSNDFQFSKYSGVLIIRAFSQRFEDTYRCIVSRTFDNVSPVVSRMSPAIFLRRCWIPSIPEGKPRKHKAENLRYFTLDCDDNGTSTGPIEYQWHYTDTPEPADTVGRMYIGLKGTLFFTMSASSDNGKAFICSISATLRGTEYKEWGRFNNIEVRAPAENYLKDPKLEYSNDPVFARRLSNASLECIFTKFIGTYPYNETVYWYLQNGTEIKDSKRYGGKYRIQSDGKRLIIVNVTEGDEMYYSCIIHPEKIGIRAGKVFLNVTAEPVFTNRPPATRTVIQGTDAVFNCETVSVSGARAPGPVKWYINAARMQLPYDKTKLVLSQKNTVLTVKNVQKVKDIMCVQCEVANNVDTAFNDACINVWLPVTFVAKPPNIQRVVHGDVVNLTVIVQADPAAHLQYRWEYGHFGFDLNSTPPYVISNPRTMEVFINTSLLPAGELEDITGRFNIFVTTEHEKCVVGTDVVFIPWRDTITHTPEGTTTPPTSDDNGDGLFFWLVLLLILIFVACVIITIIICMHLRHIRKPAKKRQQRDTVAPEAEEKAIDQPNRSQEENIDEESSDYSDEVGSQV